MAFAIRNERPGDELAIRKVVEQAFGQSTEADLIDALRRSRALSHKIVIVLGDPLYYSRFGFERASYHGIDCPYQVPPEAFMVAELVTGALAGYRGIVRYRPEFDAVST